MKSDRLSLSSCLVIALVLVFTPQALARVPATPELFRLDGDRLTRVIVTVARELPELPSLPQGRRDYPVMLLRTHGVLDVLEGRSVHSVAGLSTGSGPIGRPPDSGPMAYMHLLGAESDRVVRVVEVLATPDGFYVGEQVWPEVEGPPREEINPIRFERLSDGWSAYRGEFAGADEPLGTVVELERPYIPSRFTMDRETVQERLFNGVRLRDCTPTSRVVGQDPIDVRLPAGYSPARPAGLIVWISPVDDGGVPGFMHDALDEFGLIGIGARNSGNQRHVNDRFQLALDGVATATRRYHVDPERIYVTGMSGGGRTSSMLATCFPDVFMGCIPIVGMNTYRDVPLGNGRYSRRTFYKPAAEIMGLLRDRRFAPITGPPDFNHLQTLGASRILRGDGVEVNVFSYDDMGHVYPTAPRFKEALAWLDEPARVATEEGAAAAEQMLAGFYSRFKSRIDDGVDGARARALLMDVMEAGPWSPAAWTALELLGGGDSP